MFFDLTNAYGNVLWNELFEVLLKKRILDKEKNRCRKKRLILKVDSDPWAEFKKERKNQFKEELIARAIYLFNLINVISQ